MISLSLSLSIYLSIYLSLSLIPVSSLSLSLFLSFSLPLFPRAFGLSFQACLDAQIEGIMQWLSEFFHTDSVVVTVVRLRDLSFVPLWMVGVALVTYSVPLLVPLQFLSKKCNAR